jgi:hypothetical protein
MRAIWSVRTGSWRTRSVGWRTAGIAISVCSVAFALSGTQVATAGPLEASQEVHSTGALGDDNYRPEVTTGFG